MHVVFLACAGSIDYAGPDSHSRVTQPPYCLPHLGIGVGILIFRPFRSSITRPTNASVYEQMKFDNYLAHL